MAAASTISLTFESWPAGIQGTTAIHDTGTEQNRAISDEHPQAAQKEEAEEGEMAVRTCPTSWPKTAATSTGLSVSIRASERST